MFAQHPTKVFRIGSLSTSNPDLAAFYSAALQDRLRELGWQPGVDVLFEHRYAEGDLSRLDTLAVELVRAKVDVVVVTYDTTAQAVRRATSTIPIVAIDMNDPVGRGLAASLARPGGTVTGVAWTSVGSQLFVKPLQHLRELRSRLSRVAALHEASPAFRSFRIAVNAPCIRSSSPLSTKPSRSTRPRSEATVRYPSYS